MLVLTACNTDDGVNSASKEMAKFDVNTPDGAFMILVVSMKYNDIKSLAKNYFGQKKYNRFTADFEDKKARGFSKSEKAKFARSIAMFTAEDAEENLYALAAPMVGQARAMLPSILTQKEQITDGMEGFFYVRESLTKTASVITGATIDWAGDNDILSEDKINAAIAAVVRTVKALDIKTLDEVENMDFDQVMEKASTVFLGVKNLFGAFGIEIDNMLNSVVVDSVDVEGDIATMNISFYMFGKQLKQVFIMERKDGIWVVER